MIDEVLHILHSISNSNPSTPASIFKISDRPLRTHEVLQELRDISTMAIDHFDEKISPRLKAALNERPSRQFLSCTPLQAHRMYNLLLTFHSSMRLMFGRCRFPTVSPVTVEPTCLSLSLPMCSSLSSSGTCSSTASTPQKQNVARLIDPYRCAYVRMERKFKSAMQRVRLHSFFPLYPFIRTFIYCFAFAAFGFFYGTS